MTRKAIDLLMGWSDFKFHAEDMKFINRQFTPYYGKYIQPLADSLHWFGAERSANPASFVDFKASIATAVDTGKVATCELYTIRDAKFNIPFLSIALSTRDYDDGKGFIIGNCTQELGLGEQVINLYDQAFAAVKPELDDHLVSTHFALRTRLKTAADLCTDARFDADNNEVHLLIRDGDRAVTIALMFSGLPLLNKFLLPEAEVA